MFRPSRRDFLLRTGKSMAESRQTIALAFREPPLRMFRLARGERASQRPNELMIEFGDPGSISARFLAKVPGPGIDLREAAMTFQYDESFGSAQLEAYERLLYDAMMGDQTLFHRLDIVEAGWQVVDPILRAWRADTGSTIPTYAPGSWGPTEADLLLDRDDRSWRN